ncbi:hypothetical protein IAQ61_008200 [Plenodomus lingam]|uniref:uncharacterized protein n=1 Tax=Leptosphaeria maculans TaxID=5022 RepID=UPI00331961C3|nr:hypothetical protein IAQ61_008200 [Plenodomus lingam]
MGGGSVAESSGPKENTRCWLLQDAGRQAGTRKFRACRSFLRDPIDSSAPVSDQSTSRARRNFGAGQEPPVGTARYSRYKVGNGGSGEKATTWSTLAVVPCQCWLIEQSPRHR